MSPCRPLSLSLCVSANHTDRTRGLEESHAKKRVVRFVIFWKLELHSKPCCFRILLDQWGCWDAVSQQCTRTQGLGRQIPGWFAVRVPLLPLLSAESTPNIRVAWAVCIQAPITQVIIYNPKVFAHENHREFIRKDKRISSGISFLLIVFIFFIFFPIFSTFPLKRLILKGRYIYTWKSTTSGYQTSCTHTRFKMLG